MKTPNERMSKTKKIFSSFIWDNKPVKNFPNPPVIFFTNVQPDIPPHAPIK